LDLENCTGTAPKVENRLASWNGVSKEVLAVMPKAKFFVTAAMAERDFTTIGSYTVNATILENETYNHKGLKQAIPQLDECNCPRNLEI